MNYLKLVATVEGQLVNIAPDGSFTSVDSDVYFEETYVETLRRFYWYASDNVLDTVRIKTFGSSRICIKEEYPKGIFLRDHKIMYLGEEIDRNTQFGILMRTATLELFRGVPFTDFPFVFHLEGQSVFIPPEMKPLVADRGIAVKTFEDAVMIKLMNPEIRADYLEIYYTR